MKQTLNFENDAYRRLCGELVKRRHPVRWITCGAFAVVIMAAAVSLTFFANTPVTAESPLRGMETEQEEITARVEPLPEVITRTHTETVALPVQVTITQESVTEPLMTEPYLMATLSEPVLPDTEPISYDNNPRFTDVSEPIHAGDLTFYTITDDEWGEVVFFQKNEQVKNSDKLFSMYNGQNYLYQNYLRWYWTGEELLLISEEWRLPDSDACYEHYWSCDRYRPDDSRSEQISYSLAAELLRYRWTYRGEDYTYFTKGKTLYRRQESSGKEVALYRSDNPLAIACVSGRYLFFDEIISEYSYPYYILYRVDLLTGEKNCLFYHPEEFPYYGKDGEDLLFLRDSSSLIRVHTDGNYQAENLPSAQEYSSEDKPFAQEYLPEDEPVATPDEPQRAEIEVWSDDDNDLQIDLTDEIRKMYPDTDVTMYTSSEYLPKGYNFCAKIFEIREYKNQYAVLGVYIGKHAENGIIGDIQTVIIPEFDGYFYAVDFPDPYHIIYPAFFDTGEIRIMIEVWNDSIGDYDTEIITIPYDRSATRDSAE